MKPVGRLPSVTSKRQPVESLGTVGTVGPKGPYAAKRQAASRLPSRTSNRHFQPTLTPALLLEQRRAIARQRRWTVEPPCEVPAAMPGTAIRRVNIRDRPSDASRGVCNPFAVGGNQIQKEGTS